MFNNRFNSSKNDPLLEAVRQAQMDGECRRQAEQIVNEEFGVYSRRAVVREHLAAYDARVEQTYVELKEGITIEPSEINPVPRKPQVGSGNVPHQTGSGQTVNPKDNKEIAVEALDAVGDEDPDMDNDGKKNTKSDKYLLHRRAVRSAAIGEGNDLDEANATTSKGVPKKYAHGLAGYHLNKMDDDIYDSDKAARKADRDQKALKSTVTKKYGKDAADHADAVANRYARKAVGHARPYHFPDDKKDTRPTREVDYEKTAAVRHGDAAVRASERSGKRNIKEGSAMDPKDPSVQGSRDVTSTPPAKPMARKAPNDPSVQGSGDVTMGGKPARIDELSKKTLGSYVKKASYSALSHGAGYAGSGGDKMHLRKGANRVRGIEKAVDRLAKEETQLDELSRETLYSYKDKAKNDVYGMLMGSKRSKKPGRWDARLKGIEKANKRLGGSDNWGKLDEKSQLSELNRSTLVSYIRKAAKAKATPENISKRGKGMEMAGKKIEKMEEDRSFKSARVTESNKLGLGKSVNEVAMSMPPVVTPPAIAGQRMPGIIKRSGTATGSFVKPTTATANQPNPSAAAKTTMQRGMSAAGQEASKLVKPPAPYERIAQQAVTKAPGIVGAASRFAANPIVGGVAMAMDPTPANQGENEFARQAKYAPKTTPGSMNISKQPAPTVSTSAAAEKVGISQTAKPSVAPAAAQAKPSIKQSFSQAYRAAREAGGSKAQFEYGGKQYQAAAKKSEYVPMSKQVKVDTATKPTVTQAEPKAQTPGPATQTPAAATASWKDQGAAEKERMAKEKPVTAPTPNVPSVSDTSADVSGTTAFTQSPKYSMPKDMKGTYSGAPATSIPSSGTRFRMPKEMGGSFAMSEGSDKEPKSTEPKEIGKYDFTNIMPVMKPEDIKKSKELTATPKIRNMQESVQVGSNKYRIV